MHTETTSNPLSCYMIIVIGIICMFLLFYSADWVIVILSVAMILWQVFIFSRYFVAKIFTGNLLIRIPKDRNLPLIILGGVLVTIAAVIRIIQPSEAFSPVKAYSLETLLIVSGLFRIIEVFLCTEIRENGILCETGAFYHWKNIESFDWADMDNKLSVKLRNSFINNYAKIEISSSYKKEVTDSFSHYANSKQIG